MDLLTKKLVVLEVPAKKVGDLVQEEQKVKEYLRLSLTAIF